MRKIKVCLCCVDELKLWFTPRGHCSLCDLSETCSQRVSYSNGNAAFTRVCELFRNHQKHPTILGRAYPPPNASVDCDAKSLTASKVSWKVPQIQIACVAIHKTHFTLIIFLFPQNRQSTKLRNLMLLLSRFYFGLIDHYIFLWCLQHKAKEFIGLSFFKLMNK